MHDLTKRNGKQCGDVASGEGLKHTGEVIIKRQTLAQVQMHNPQHRNPRIVSGLSAPERKENLNSESVNRLSQNL